MVINVHTHVYHDPEKYDKKTLIISQLPVPESMELWKKNGVDKVCVCPGGRMLENIKNNKDNGNNVVESLFLQYPDFFIGFGRVRPEKDKPEYIDNLAKRGFKGLKFMDPATSYDDECIFPFYEKAEKHGLPCLFHTGWLGMGSKNEKRRYITRVRNMEPMTLDTIARVFPGLKIIGAHLGNAAYCMQAVELCRYQPNIYFDLTGGSIRKLPWEFIKILFGCQKEESLVNPETVCNEKVMKKFIFGSDNAIHDIFLTFHKNLFEMLNVPEEVRKGIMGGTLARLLNLQERMPG
jgi:predicted TIM-barrel fold metal-dependent hydrolase